MEYHFQMWFSNRNCNAAKSVAIVSISARYIEYNSNTQFILQIIHLHFGEIIQSKMEHTYKEKERKKKYEYKSKENFLSNNSK